MKNKRIRFDDRFYWTTLNIALLVLVLFFLLLMIKNNAPLGICVFLSIVFSLFLCGLYVFPKMGLYFNYRLGIIKYLGPHKIKKRLIKMCEIEKIEFIEIYVPKGSGVTSKYYMALGDKVATVYKNGKIFKFVIYLKNDDIIEIPYNNLFKARSKKRVLRQEEKISNIIKEFNLFSNSK